MFFDCLNSGNKSVCVLPFLLGVRSITRSLSSPGGERGRFFPSSCLRSWKFWFPVKLNKSVYVLPFLLGVRSITRSLSSPGGERGRVCFPSISCLRSWSFWFPVELTTATNAVAPPAEGGIILCRVCSVVLGPLDRIICKFSGDREGATEFKRSVHVAALDPNPEFVCFIA